MTRRHLGTWVRTCVPLQETLVQGGPWRLRNSGLILTVCLCPPLVLATFEVAPLCRAAWNQSHVETLGSRTVVHPPPLVQSPQTKPQTHVCAPVLEPPRHPPVAVEGQPQNYLESAWKQYVGNCVPTKGSKKGQKRSKNDPKNHPKKIKKDQKRIKKGSKKVKKVKKGQKRSKNDQKMIKN